MKKSLLASMLPGLLLVHGAAQAAGCQVGASGLAFGNYAFNSPADVESTAVISVGPCVDAGGGPDITYSISIGPGGSLQPNARAMIGAGGTLRYNVYVDANRSLVWGDGSDGSVAVTGAVVLPLSTASVHTAYGRIPARQTDIAAGAYSDQLVITVTY